MPLQETEEFQKVSTRNDVYRKLAESSETGNDTREARHAQTLNLAQRTKEATAAPPPTREAAVTATSYDIFGTRQPLPE